MGLYDTSIRWTCGAAKLHCMELRQRLGQEDMAAAIKWAKTFSEKTRYKSTDYKGKMQITKDNKQGGGL